MALRLNDAGWDDAVNRCAHRCKGWNCMTTPNGNGIMAAHQHIENLNDFIHAQTNTISLVANQRDVLHTNLFARTAQWTLSQNTVTRLQNETKNKDIEIMGLKSDILSKDSQIKSYKQLAVDIAGLKDEVSSKDREIDLLILQNKDLRGEVALLKENFADKRSFADILGSQFDELETLMEKIKLCKLSHHLLL